MAVINGTNAGDSIPGTDSDDTIDGKGGSDRLEGRDGHDSILGGDGNDILEGGAGDDSLFGGAGDDVFFDNEGDDIIDGGEGGEDQVFFGWFSKVTVNLVTGIATNNFGETDTLIDIEQVTGTFGNDLLIGGNSANDDYEFFEGEAGRDTIDGGSGHDVAFYGGSSRGIVANLSTGVVRDEYGDRDHLISIEEIIATNADDILVGNAENNIFQPRAGSDEVRGGAGIDTASYATNLWAIDADLARGDVIDFYRDVLTGIEGVIGSDFDDQLRGDRHNNRLEGRRGDDLIAGRRGSDTCLGGVGGDHLDGGRGADLLNGGVGDDFLRGARGADVFAFDLISDWDTVRDFRGGLDKMDVTAYGFSSGADVLARAAERGSSVIIKLSDDSTIELANTTLDQISASDFLV